MKKLLILLSLLALPLFAQDVGNRPLFNPKLSGTGDFSGLTNKSTVRTHLGAQTQAAILDTLAAGSGTLNLSGFTLTIPTLPIGQGGTGSTTAADARTALSAAKSGANTDLTSIVHASLDFDSRASAGMIDGFVIGSRSALGANFQNLGASGAVTMTAGTSSSSTTTGTLVVTGGVGISGALNIGTALSGANGGTGVSNSGKTITLAGNLTTTGAFNTTIVQTGTAAATFPSTNWTAARTDAAQTFTGTQTISAVSADAELTAGTFNVNADGLSDVRFGVNLYNDGSSWRYRATGAASHIMCFGAEIQLHPYAAGTAGTTLANSGNNTCFKANTANTVALGGSINVAAANYTGASMIVSPTEATVNVPLVMTPQALTTAAGTGVVNVTTGATAVTTTGAGDALSLANGTNGQIKTVVHDVDGGSFVLTPTTKTGFTSYTSTVVGETVTLQYFTTRGWMIIGSYGGTIAP